MIFAPYFKYVLMTWRSANPWRPEPKIVPNISVFVKFIMKPNFGNISVHIFFLHLFHRRHVACRVAIYYYSQNPVLFNFCLV